MAIRFVSLSSGNSAFMNSTTGEAIVLNAGAPAKFVVGPQPDSAWQTAQAILAQGQATLFSAAQLKQMLDRTGTVVMLSGPGPSSSSF